MTLDSINNFQCQEGEGNHSDVDKGAEKNHINTILSCGIEISDKEEFKQIAEIFKKEGIIDMTNIDFDDISDGYAVALRRIKGQDDISVFPISVFGEERKTGEFYRGGKITLEGYENAIDKNESYQISGDNKFQEVLSKYESYQSNVKEQCQNELGTLRNDFEPFVFPDMNKDDIKITYTSHLDTDDANIDNLYAGYTVKQGDTIWGILQSAQYGCTESQANTLLKVLEKDSDFVKTLKSGNIHKIYPGEKIVFPKNLGEMIHLSNQEEENVPENVYEVQNGDTPGKIIFDNYSGVDWKNMKAVMLELGIGDIIKVGQKITLKDFIELQDGTQINKKTK